jgi:hypothetical protein
VEMRAHVVDGHGRKRERLSNVVLPALGSATVIFLVVLYFIFNHMSSVYNEGTISVMDNTGTSTYGELRVVTLTNMFPEEIELYFDDNEAGIFLTNMNPYESTKFSASNGHVLYATGENSVERLASITIRENVDMYRIQPSRRLPLPRNERVKYEIGSREMKRKHPQVVLLNSHSSGMGAKFKSLSNRMLDLWFDDGREGIYEGHLRPGQVTTTNTYIGHKFFVTVHGKKSEVVSKFTIRPDKVIYEIRDDGHDASPSIMAEYERERAFMEDYYNRTGIHWRHYFGPHGPRPPPVLFMWPADKVGQVHTVESPEGFW